MWYFERKCNVYKKDVMLYLLNKRIINDLELGDANIASPPKECYSKNRMMKGMMDE